MSRLRSAALALVVVTGTVALLGGCAGSGGGSAATTTTAGASGTDPLTDALAVRVWYDPTQPIDAAVGERFTIVIPSDPSVGRRWVPDPPVDTKVVVPLGSTYTRRDDPAVAAATTTTAPPPPPSTSVPVGGSTTTTASTVAPTTTTTEPRPWYQVMSFVGRAPGTTTITLRYRQVGSADPNAPSTTFTVTVTAPAPVLGN